MVSFKRGRGVIPLYLTFLLFDFCGGYNRAKQPSTHTLHTPYSPFCLLLYYPLTYYGKKSIYRGRVNKTVEGVEGVEGCFVFFKFSQIFPIVFETTIVFVSLHEFKTTLHTQHPPHPPHPPLFND
jgi:hypothetical protein